MGQVIETVASNKTDFKTYQDRKPANIPFTGKSSWSDQESSHHHIDGKHFSSKKPSDFSDTSNDFKDKQDMQAHNDITCNNSEESNPRQAEKITANNVFFKNEEHLCTGEVLDERQSAPINGPEKELENVKKDGLEDKRSQDPMNCAEKRRQFSLSKSQQSEGSFSSDVSSDSRPSFSSYLHAREYNAEEILLGLGFGFEGLMDIPVRFLNSDSLLPSKSVSSSTSFSVLQRFDSDRPESDEVSSRTSFESSWSNSSFGRLPSRFTTSSISRLSSVSSLISEPEDNDSQSPIPSIVEPEKEQNDGFDLMRHLRLNRGLHEKGFLEPVKEELEVSSVGSGSARTKVSAQQDSFDSVGNISVVTKISVQQEQLDDFKQNKSEFVSLISNMNSLNEKSVEITKEIAVVTDELEVTSVDKLDLPSMNNSFESRIVQESFELEEIATSEENLDKLEGATPTDNLREKSRLRRDHSDDSSGFEDDGAETSRRTSPETLHSSLEKTSEADHDRQDEKHLLVPVRVSTPKNDAATKRSNFAKSRSWSASKQKRVVFEDEAHNRCRSCENSSVDDKTYKHITRSRSLDVPLPISNRAVFSQHDRDAQTRDCSLSKPVEFSYKGSLEEVTKCSLDEQVRHDGKLTGEDAVTRKRAFSDNAAIRNLREFMSGLLSLRSKLKKSWVPSKGGAVPNLIKCKENCSSNLERVATAGEDCSAFTQPSLRQTMDHGKTTCTTSSITLTSCQKVGHQELSSFEEDLQKYRSTFVAMEVISTSQDKHYARKLKARFAWDILIIRRLRSHINKELNELRSNLNCTSRLPSGAQNQMNELLKLQSALRDNLLTLASASTYTTPQMQTFKPTSVQSLNEVQSIEAFETKIRYSVVEEISSMFQSKINELRDEMKAKDSLIEKLLKRLPEIEQS